MKTISIHYLAGESSSVTDLENNGGTRDHASRSLRKPNKLHLETIERQFVTIAVQLNNYKCLFIHFYMPNTLEPPSPKPSY